MTVFWALLAQAVISITRILTTVTVGGRFAFLAPADTQGVGSPEQLSLYYAAFGVLTVMIAMHEGFVTTPMTVFLPRQLDLKKFSGLMLLGSLSLIGFGLCLVTAWIFWQYQFGGGMTIALLSDLLRYRFGAFAIATRVFKKMAIGEPASEAFGGL